MSVIPIAVRPSNLCNLVKKQISVKCLKKSDAVVPQALNFLKAHYLSNEPISKSLGVKGNTNDCKVMDRFFRNCLESDSSVIATDDKSGNIVGVYLSYITTRDRSTGNNVDWSMEKLNPSFGHRTYIELVDQKLEEMDLFTMFPNAQRIMEHVYGATHPDWLHKGIAQASANYVKCIIAPEKKCDVCFAISTSSYSARVMQKLGYSEYWRIPYEDIRDNGEAIFKVDNPQDSIICSIFELSPK